MGKGYGSGKGLGQGAGHGTGAGKGQGSGDGAGDYRGKTERIAMPAMPMPMAVVCCVLNFIFPGLGTVVAGFSNFCCARNEDIDGAVRMVSCCTNFGIGLLQFALTLVFFIGWAWSCLWGVYFIMMSSDYYHNNRVDDVDRNQGAIIQYNQPTIIATQPGAANVNVVSLVRQPIGQTFGQPVIQSSAYGQMVVMQPSVIGQTVMQPTVQGQTVIQSTAYGQTVIQPSAPGQSVVLQ